MMAAIDQILFNTIVRKRWIEKNVFSTVRCLGKHLRDPEKSHELL